MIEKGNGSAGAREQAPVEQTLLSWQGILILACKYLTKDSFVAGAVPGVAVNLWTIEGAQKSQTALVPLLPNGPKYSYEKK